MQASDKFLYSTRAISILVSVVLLIVLLTLDEPEKVLVEFIGGSAIWTDAPTGCDNVCAVVFREYKLYDVFLFNILITMFSIWIAADLFPILLSPVFGRLHERVRMGNINHEFISWGFGEAVTIFTIILLMGENNLMAMTMGGMTHILVSFSFYSFVRDSNSGRKNISYLSLVVAIIIFCILWGFIIDAYNHSKEDTEDFSKILVATELEGMPAHITALVVIAIISNIAIIINILLTHFDFYGIYGSDDETRFVYSAIAHDFILLINRITFSIVVIAYIINTDQLLVLSDEELTGLSATDSGSA